MNSVDFLTSVWNEQGPGFVCLSSKNGDKWREHSFPKDDKLPENLEDFLDSNVDNDVYFCPLVFSKPRRSKNFAEPSKFLWGDIDHGNPSKIKPSVLWESSPGRFAGLWRMPAPLPAEEASELSRRIAYQIGGDRGGWDITQVLRIPGTKNFKYPSAPTVELRDYSKRILKEVPMTPLDRWRSSIPRKLIRIIEGPAEQGKRSDMLWYLEHELCDLGIPIGDVVEILRDSDWNKYRGRADEDERFQSEMDKLRADRDEKKSATRVESVSLEVVDYAALMGSQSSTPGWMVKDFWMKNSHGIIAGEPKSFKSTLAMDMLFAVASDKPFLGQFPVEYGGPVLIVQNENADWIMKDRLEKLAFNRGEVGNVKTSAGTKMRIEWARNLPIFFVNQQGFTLDDAANKEALEDLIRRLRPAAIKLDPLYLMFNGDVNSAKDLNPVLQWCLYIKQEYDCSVILVHHYNKGGEGRRGGQRMLGSTTLHGWIESAWYIQANAEVGNLVTLDREFRGAGLYHKLDVSLDIGPSGTTQYQVTVGEHQEEAPQGASNELEQAILDVLATATDMMSITSISKGIGSSRDRTKKLVESLVRDGQLIRSGERYGLGKQYRGNSDE